MSGTSYDYTWSFDGSSDLGYNLSAPGTLYAGSTASELAYMFYNNLGGTAYWDTDGNEQTGYGFTTTGPFINLATYRQFWSGSPYSASNDLRWDFSFYIGMQNDEELIQDEGVWVVRDGDVPQTNDTPAEIPEPMIIGLLGIGLIGCMVGKKH